ncbi:MAG: glutathione synthase [Alphaproteobacteria bacterium]|nr:glutathione synthase [Alphaproteobacteria bacterium]
MLRIAVQMDPIDTMIVTRDTSLAFMLEAQARGHEIWWMTPHNLFFDTGRVMAAAHRVRVAKVEGAHYETLASQMVDLAGFDVVLIRQDPPFDMAYVANTYLLELLPPRVQVINAPRGVRDIPEKLSTLHFGDLVAATFVGRNVEALHAFAARYDQVVLKPSFFAGGEGVRKTSAGAPDFADMVGAMLAEVGKEPLIAQEFIPGVKDGDKRVFMLDGQAIGAVRRLPKAGEFRANLHVGGQAAAGALDDRDREICARVAPLLAERGILFAGLDVIDGRLTEINVTSPTLVQQLSEFGGPDIPSAFWDIVERRAKAG